MTILTVNQSQMWLEIEALTYLSYIVVPVLLIYLGSLVRNYSRRKRRCFVRIHRAGEPISNGKSSWKERVGFKLDKWEVEALIISMQESPRAIIQFPKLMRRLTEFYKQEERRDVHGSISRP